MIVKATTKDAHKCFDPEPANPTFFADSVTKSWRRTSLNHIQIVISNLNNCNSLIKCFVSDDASFGAA